MKKYLLIPAALSAAVFVSTPAFADDDRAPNPTEKAAIAEALGKAGIKSWEEIELDRDDNHWEVDDAKDAQGQTWDIKLSTGDYRIIERDRED